MPSSALWRTRCPVATSGAWLPRLRCSRWPRRPTWCSACSPRSVRLACTECCSVPISAGSPRRCSARSGGAAVRTAGGRRSSFSTASRSGRPRRTRWKPSGAVPAEGAVNRAKLLEARVGDRVETALIDVAVSTERHVGARAVWDPATVTQLFCAFAEPDAIGLSSVLGQLSPVARHEPHGVTARLAADAPRQVLAPIAPGLVVPVGVREIEPMHPGSVHTVEATAGVIAVDGERELTFEPGGHPTVRLRADGPRCVDVPAVLAVSTRLGLLKRSRQRS